MADVHTLAAGSGGPFGRRVEIVAFPTTGNRMSFRVMLCEGMDLIESHKFTAVSKAAIRACELAIQHGCRMTAGLEAVALFARKH